MEVDWLQVPEFIIEDIAEFLASEVSDFIRFSAVCRSWKAAADKVGKKRYFAPWVMLPFPEVGNGNVRKCFSLSGEEIYHLNLPGSQGMRFLGSPLGWLLTVGTDNEISLLNPLKHNRILLPRFQCPYDELLVSVNKYALSSITPDSEQCYVVIVFDSPYHDIMFCRPRDEAWTSIKGLFLGCAGHDDVIFFDGRFYVTDAKGNILICEINATHPNLKRFMKPPLLDVLDMSVKFFLVEMSGNLHLVVWIFREYQNTPEGNKFSVFKLDFETMEWTELADLGCHALFLGNTSFSFLTSNYPNLKQNSIYFTGGDYSRDEHKDSWGHDMWIFDFGSKRVDHFYTGDEIGSAFNPPLFFMPSLE